MNDGNRENGEWADNEVYWRIESTPPGKYKLVVKTDCATSNEMDLEVVEG